MEVSESRRWCECGTDRSGEWTFEGFEPGSGPVIQPVCMMVHRASGQLRQCEWYRGLSFDFYRLRQLAWGGFCVMGMFS